MMRRAAYRTSFSRPPTLRDVLVLEIAVINLAYRGVTSRLKNIQVSLSEIVRGKTTENFMHSAGKNVIGERFGVYTYS